MSPYLIVASDFIRTGGMDMANLALATHLADLGGEVHLVGHSAERDLAARANVTLHRVARPAASNLLASPLLDWTGRQWAGRIAARGGRVVVNGGNCLWGDINWVHYVHGAFAPRVEGGLARRARWQAGHRYYLRGERLAVGRARIVLANSRATADDCLKYLSARPDLVRTVYYGADSEQLRPALRDERAASRRALGWDDETPRAVFLGALGDRRKGFDTLFAAWKTLCAEPAWDARLAVIGAGGELDAWKRRAAEAGLERRIEFLGFRRDVPAVLAACDLMVAPTRYEAYGLGVQEAICRGLPALVTASAGIAERYPESLRDLLLPDPEDAADLARRIRAWHGDRPGWKRRFEPLSAELRARTWKSMAAEIVALAGAAA